jgi:hypothetical protein
LRGEEKRGSEKEPKREIGKEGRQCQYQVKLGQMWRVVNREPPPALSSDRLVLTGRNQMDNNLDPRTRKEDQKMTQFRHILAVTAGLEKHPGAAPRDELFPHWAKTSESK